MLTLEQFIEREIIVWGEDYVFDLLDKGYMPVLLTDQTGSDCWKWRYVTNAEFQQLTQTQTSAIV